MPLQAGAFTNQYLAMKTLRTLLIQLAWSLLIYAGVFEAMEWVTNLALFVLWARWILNVLYSGSKKLDQALKIFGWSRKIIVASRILQVLLLAAGGWYWTAAVWVADTLMTCGRMALADEDKKKAHA